MIEFLKGAGVFIYPLALCSLLAVMVFLERLLALRSIRVFPENVARELLQHPKNPVSGNSVLERLVRLIRKESSNRESVQTFLRMEMDGLQRGIFVLDIVVSVAPLLGLMGTVAGLVSVFSGTGESGIPDQKLFSEGIALALSTTLIGLAIAIPSLMVVTFFNRRIERFGNQLDAWIERWGNADKAES